MHGAGGESRNALLDVVRGIGICLVVAGHTQASADVVTPMYVFHMPLFLLLTGATYGYARNRGSFRTYAARRARRLLWPYLATAPLFYLIWLVVGRRFGEQAALAVPPLKPLLGIVYASGANHWMVFNVALWYLPAVFVAEAAFWWAHRAAERRGGGAPDIRQPVLVAVVALAAVAGWAIGRVAYLPWSADVALFALPLLLIGSGLRTYGWFDAHPGPRRVVAFAVAAAVYLLALRWNGRVDMMGRVWGNPVVFYLGGVAGTLALIEVARLAARWAPIARPAAYLGRESMFILLFHLLGIRVLSAVLALALPGDGAALRQALWWAYVPFAVGFSLLVAAGIRRSRWLAPVFYPDVQFPTGPAGRAGGRAPHDPDRAVARSVSREMPAVDPRRAPGERAAPSLLDAPHPAPED